MKITYSKHHNQATWTVEDNSGLKCPVSMTHDFSDPEDSMPEKDSAGIPLDMECSETRQGIVYFEVRYPASPDMLFATTTDIYYNAIDAIDAARNAVEKLRAQMAEQECEENAVGMN
jgi:hypothetical protein